MPIRILPKTDKHDEYSRKQRQKQYMDKHGEPGPRRKRLNPDLTAQKRAGKIEDLHERMGGGEKGKPHSSREGRVASGKRRLERYRKKAEDVMSGKPTIKLGGAAGPKKRRKPSGVKILKAKGGRAGYQGGGRTRLLEELGRVEAEPSNRNRRAEISRVHGELNRGYKTGGRIGLKHGNTPRGPKDKWREKIRDWGSRKSPVKSGASPKGHKQPLPPDYWKDRLKDIGKRFPRPRENLIEKMGGSEKAKPHSSREGRVASGKRRIRRILKDANKPRPPERRRPGVDHTVPDPRRKPGKPKPIDPRSPYVKDRVMTPLRAKHGIGSLVKKGISKILKPKGKGLGSGIKPSEVKDILKSPGKSWGKTRAEYLREYAPYFGGRSIKKQVKEGVQARNKESKKVFKSAKGKAAGGRISRGHGGSATQQHYLQHGYGPTKIKLRAGKPKLAKKGW
jgi:hypothetical protein